MIQCLLVVSWKVACFAWIQRMLIDHCKAVYLVTSQRNAIQHARSSRQMTLIYYAYDTSIYYAYDTIIYYADDTYLLCI